MADNNGNEKREYIRLAGMYGRSKNVDVFNNKGKVIDTKTEEFMLSNNIGRRIGKEDANIRLSVMQNDRKKMMDSKSADAYLLIERKNVDDLIAYLQQTAIDYDTRMKDRK